MDITIYQTLLPHDDPEASLAFYRDTLDSEYAAHRQRFLAEQGYAYTIVDAADLAGPGEVNGPDWVDEPAD